MDTDLLILVCGAPLYTIAIIVIAYLGGFAMHSMKTLLDSATEQQITETTNPATPAVTAPTKV